MKATRGLRCWRCLVVRGNVDVVAAGDLTLTEAAWCQDEAERGSLTVAGPGRSHWCWGG